MPNKKMVMVKGRERRFITQPGQNMERDEVGTQSIFNHLWATELSYGFK
jgi:hypothetical protein